MRYLAVAAIALSFGAAQAGAREQADVLVRHATVVDVEHGRLIKDQAVATRGDRIVAVGRDAEVAKAWRAKATIQAGGKFLIPGLWDMHVHFGGGPALIEENKALLPLYVAHGITTVRDASGELTWVEQEAHLDAVTALSGSGPAYVFLFLEAMTQAGLDMGLTAGQAYHLAVATFQGGAELAARSSDSAEVLRQRVTSKGGTTHAAITHMQDTHVPEHFIAAMRKAEARAKELAAEFGR